jgi:hypothetical protein
LDVIRDWRPLGLGLESSVPSLLSEVDCPSVE